MKTTHQKAEGTKGNHWRDLWTSGTGKGRQEAQPHDSYMIIIIIIIILTDQFP
jgi:hypothetical protein